MIGFDFLYVIQHKVLIVLQISLEGQQATNSVFYIDQTGLDQPFGCSKLTVDIVEHQDQAAIAFNG